MSAADRAGFVALVHGRILAYPGEPYDLQCVATTTRDRRCRNGVEPSQTATWTHPHNRYDTDNAHDPDTADRFARQRCRVHVHDDQPDHVPPQWQEVRP